MSEQPSQAHACSRCGQDMKGSWVCAHCGHVDVAYYIGGAAIALFCIAIAIVATIALSPARSGGRIAALAGADLVCGGTGLIVFLVVLSEIKKGGHLLRQLGDRSQGHTMRKAIGWVIGLSVVGILVSAGVGLYARGGDGVGSSVLKMGREPTPMPTLFPTPSILLPRPVVIDPRWEGAEIETLCFQVSTTYSSVTENTFDPPIDAVVRQIVTGLGLQVVEGNNSCDATLALALDVEALSGTYWNVGTCYTGALVDGKLTLDAPGYPTLARTFGGEKAVSGSTSTCPRAAEAPFAWLWEYSLVDSLTSFWGPQAALHALDVPNGFLQTATGGWLREALGSIVSGERYIWRVDNNLSDDHNQAEEWAAERELIISGLVWRMQQGHVDAADLLQEVGPDAEAAIPYLVQELVDPQHMQTVYLRKQVITMLKGFGGKAWSTTPYFIEALRKEQDGTMKHEMAQALKEITGRDRLTTDADDWQKWWEEQQR